MSLFPPLSELLPHAAPMILLDEVIAYEDESATCRVVIRPGALFVEGGRAEAVIALEYMAQTIGAFAGLEARARGAPPCIGYLLGTRELSLHLDAFEVGDALLVRATRLFDDGALSSFACTVTRGDTLAASATLNVYRGEELPS